MTPGAPEVRSRPSRRGAREGLKPPPGSIDGWPGEWFLGPAREFRARPGAGGGPGTEDRTRRSPRTQEADHGFTSQPAPATLRRRARTTPPRPPPAADRGGRGAVVLGGVAALGAGA